MEHVSLKHLTTVDLNIKKKMTRRVTTGQTISWLGGTYCIVLNKNIHFNHGSTHSLLPQAYLQYHPGCSRASFWWTMDILRLVSNEGRIWCEYFYLSPFPLLSVWLHRLPIPANHQIHFTYQAMFFQSPLYKGIIRHCMNNTNTSQTYQHQWMPITSHTESTANLLHFSKQATMSFIFLHS